MTTYYRIDPRYSRFTVQAFSSGLLSFLGQDPQFTVRDYTGEVTFEDDKISSIHVELEVGASSLAILDKIQPTNLEDSKKRLRGDEQTMSTQSNIVFASDAATTERTGSGQYKVALEGNLSLHGISQRYQIDAELSVFKDGLRLKGGTQLRMSRHGIGPVHALGGTIQLKDELVLSFDLAAPRGNS